MKHINLKNIIEYIKGVTSLSDIRQGADYLAGGAVANAFLALYLGKNLPIKDLDLCHVKNNEKFENGEKYSNHIIRAWYSDGINDHCLFDKKTSLIENLESFDINCCKIGIDFNKAELVVTPDFKKFLETKVIEIVKIDELEISLKRMHKKAIQYGMEEGI